MKKNYPIYDHEIDFIVLFKIVWDSKIKVVLITLISFLVGLGYISQIPVNYLTSLTISPHKTTEFLKIDNIREMLESNQSLEPGQPDILDKKDDLSQLYLARFINELADYEEFLATIKNTKKVQEDFSKLNNKDQKIKLFQYAKLFKIDAPKNLNKNYILNFKWHDPEETMKILQDTLNLTSNNLKIDINNELNNALELKKKLLMNNDKVRLDYLKEQSAIARALNVVDNQTESGNLNYQSSASFFMNIENIAYYLRGYKAIDKEIELIQNRSYQNLEFIKQEINDLKDLKINYVDYNVYLIEIETLKNTKLILMVSTLLGLIIGVFFVTIFNAFQSQTFSKKTK